MHDQHQFQVQPEESASPVPAGPVIPFDPGLVIEPDPTSADAVLTGRTVVLDPGHQLGNRNHLQEVNVPVEAGFGITKACNTTGTATNENYPEATANWEISLIVARELEALGAEVLMTRSENSNSAWGPCINERASLGNDSADLLLSIHADGAAASINGFYLLLPGKERDIYTESEILAIALKESLEQQGFHTSTMVSDGLRPSNDYGTINLSEKPTVLAELGNMRNEADATLLSTPEGQQQFATALVAGVVSFLSG